MSDVWSGFIGMQTGRDCLWKSVPKRGAVSLKVRWCLVRVSLACFCACLCVCTQVCSILKKDQALTAQPVVWTFVFNPFTTTMSLENDHYRGKLQILKRFCFCLRITCEMVCIKPHRIESRLENILFAGVCLHLSARKFYRLGQWWG